MPTAWCQTNGGRRPISEPMSREKISAGDEVSESLLYLAFAGRFELRFIHHPITTWTTWRAPKQTDCVRRATNLTLFDVAGARARVTVQRCVRRLTGLPTSYFVQPSRLLISRLARACLISSPSSFRKMSGNRKSSGSPLTGARKTTAAS